MRGQTVCMCECAEIALCKHKLAWELNHLSPVPLSESPATSQLHAPFFFLVIFSFCNVNDTMVVLGPLFQLCHGINLVKKNTV